MKTGGKKVTSFRIESIEEKEKKDNLFKAKTKISLKPKKDLYKTKSLKNKRSNSKNVLKKTVSLLKEKNKEIKSKLLNGKFEKSFLIKIIEVVLNDLENGKKNDNKENEICDKIWKMLNERKIKLNTLKKYEVSNKLSEEPFDFSSNEKINTEKSFSKEIKNKFTKKSTLENKNDFFQIKNKIVSLEQRIENYDEKIKTTFFEKQIENLNKQKFEMVLEYERKLKEINCEKENVVQEKKEFSHKNEILNVENKLLQEQINSLTQKLDCVLKQQVNLEKEFEEVKLQSKIKKENFEILRNELEKMEQENNYLKIQNEKIIVKKFESENEMKKLKEFNSDLINVN